MNTAVTGSEVARFAADLIRFDTTNRGGGDGNERAAAEYVAAVLSDAGLEPVLLEAAPGRAAPLEGPLVSAMTAAVLAEDPGATVVPYCMSGGTDAKQFARLGMACYGFTPLVLPPGNDYHAMFHGADERVPISALQASLRIMDRLLTAHQARD
jgi:acetylornithine deacetylase/succinyl-diaminopimelate desuccinylase-like protein